MIGIANTLPQLPMGHFDIAKILLPLLTRKCLVISAFKKLEVALPPAFFEDFLSESGGFSF